MATRDNAYKIAKHKANTTGHACSIYRVSNTMQWMVSPFLLAESIQAGYQKAKVVEVEIIDPDGRESITLRPADYFAEKPQTHVSSSNNMMTNISKLHADAESQNKKLRLIVSASDMKVNHSIISHTYPSGTLEPRWNLANYEIHVVSAEWQSTTVIIERDQFQLYVKNGFIKSRFPYFNVGHERANWKYHPKTHMHNYDLIVPVEPITMTETDQVQ